MRRWLVFALLWLGLASPATAQDFNAPASSASLVSEQLAVAPGSRFYVALHLQLKPGWHTYWRNPGDSGLPVSLAWSLPEKVIAGDLLWPAPRVIAEGPLVTYGYLDEVTLPVEITIPADAAPGEVLSFQARADWLVCEKICIPQSAGLNLSLPVERHARPDANGKMLIEAALARRAPPLGVTGQAVRNGDQLELSFPLNALKLEPSKLRDAVFMPDQPLWMRYGAVQLKRTTPQQLTLTLTTEENAELPRMINGVLRLNTADGESVFDVRASQRAPLLPDSLPVMLLLALLGGLILNIMPCVFPVLSLKALALARHAHLHPRHARLEGLAYTAGVIVSFLVFAALLIALQSAGRQIGWGFQMQSPAFVGALAFLLFLAGLNLSGLFELPVLLGNAGGTLAKEGSLRGSFFTGVLAVAVASPCTAPFMATALGFAVTQSAAVALLVFASLGLGLALPFLLIGFIPRLTAFLPKPGPWMQTLKSLLAFPMYLSVLWLLWVLSKQTGSGSFILMAVSMLGMALGLWIRRHATHPAWRKRVAPALIVLFPLLVLFLLDPMPAEEMLAPGEVAYSAQALDTLRVQGKPVFLDATAAWCITCQFNKRTALSSARIRETFKARGITFMVADWTNENPEITALLQSFGFNGVPMYVYYPPQGDPVVLPQILTESIVLDAIK